MLSRLILIFVVLLGCTALRAQEVMRVETVTIHTDKGEFTFQTEIADSLPLRQKGLMFRREMAADAAMLFDWGAVKPVSMWMRNTYISLDMVFIAADGRVEGVATNTVPETLDVISSPVPVAAVLEVLAGTAVKIGLKRGDFVKHDLFNSKSE